MNVGEDRVMADSVVSSVAIAQSVGRWGNFFNSEAHGGSTDLPIAVIIDGQKFHPTFLYESLFCFLLFWILLWVSKKRNFKGQIALLYGMLYSLERYFVEGLRTDSLMLGDFRIAQLVSILSIFGCAIAYFILNKNSKEIRK